jgi:hypothetical protein
MSAPLALPKIYSWPTQFLIFMAMLLAIHLAYTYQVDQHWVMMTEFTHPAFNTTSDEQKLIWAEEYTQKSFLFLFVKGQLSLMISALLDLLAILAISFGIRLLVTMQISTSILLSSAFLVLLPTTLYQGVITTQLLLAGQKVQQDLAALNPWSLNELYLHLHLHHPMYFLVNQISVQLLLGMLLVVLCLRRYTQLSGLQALLLGCLPATLLLSVKFLLQP